MGESIAARASIVARESIAEQGSFGTGESVDSIVTWASNGPAEGTAQIMPARQASSSSSVDPRTESPDTGDVGPWRAMATLNFWLLFVSFFLTTGAGLVFIN